MCRPHTPLGQGQEGGRTSVLLSTDLSSVPFVSVSARLKSFARVEPLPLFLQWGGREEGDEKNRNRPSRRTANVSTSTGYYINKDILEYRSFLSQ